MLFVKGFYVFQSGYMEEAWLNTNLIKSYQVTDVYINKTGETLKVLKCDMGQESSDKIPYVDGSQPLEFKTAEEVFDIAAKLIAPKRKRGRPAKSKSAFLG